MSARAIREFDGKRLIAAHLNTNSKWLLPRVAQIKIALDTPDFEVIGSQQLEKEFDRVEVECPWVKETLLVVKPDQLLKRRGKAGLLLLKASWAEAKEWILQRAGGEIEVDGVKGLLKTFIIEPFVPHQPSDEFYVCLQARREGDEVWFCREGGVEVGDVDGKASKLFVPIDVQLEESQVLSLLREAKCPTGLIPSISAFLIALFKIYVDLHFTYLEINPLVALPQDGTVACLDLAAKLDQTAEFECGKRWKLPLVPGGIPVPVEFPAPFGREMTAEEAYIADLDGKTGASLKLTILNPHGRIWTMVAGGGASVAYADAIGAHGHAHELANYGEYSGAPSETQTYEYAKTLLDLMTRGPVNPEGKLLLIGGGIANFTNVAATFKGIIRALKEFQHHLIQHSVSIYVRRGGPNWQEGLRMMRELGDTLGVPIHVYGPDTHITAIVPIALGLKDAQEGAGETELLATGSTSNLLDQLGKSPVRLSTPQPAVAPTPLRQTGAVDPIKHFTPPPTNVAVLRPPYCLFDPDSRALVWGMQPKAVQGMLDFDYLCRRARPSVAAMIYPFGGEHVQKFYWGTQETLLPVYGSIAEAVKRHPEVDVMVNFSSHRSVLETCVETLKEAPSIRTIAVIAEGVPERHTRRLIRMAVERGVQLIGPATVGGVRAGAFKIGKNDRLNA